MSEYNKSPLEPHEEEDEDEDLDFNPFLRGSPSAEASSSLSSEVDGLDTDVVDSTADNVLHLGPDPSSNSTYDGQCRISGDAPQDEGIVLQTDVSLQEGCDEEFIKTSFGQSKKRKLNSTSTPKDGASRVKDIGSSSGTDVVNEVLGAELNTSNSTKPINNLNDEDSICNRTRARYSLASFTLDELETFLQETDDDDDLQNIDEEDEYRKFLAAVLKGGHQDDHSTLEDGNDEDEDNDADFEVEIEEALDSDLDDSLWLSSRKEESEGRRPETRQNRRNKSVKQSKKKLPELAKRPLRPLLPVLPSAPFAAAPNMNGKYLTLEAAPHTSSPQDCIVNGFTPHQIGQLYCLLHEHVQLLIQVYTLSVIEPSRQHIASQVQRLLSEMVQKREEVLAQRIVRYPSYCFNSPYLHPSATDEHPSYFPLEATGSSRVINGQGDSSSNSRFRGSSDDLPSDEVCAHSTPGPPESSHVVHGFSWLPFVGSPVLSVLDVAPLKLVGQYINDVSTAVCEHQRSYLETTASVHLEKEPLFPFLFCSSSTGVTGETLKGTTGTTTESSLQPSSPPPPQRPSRKTLAATLVENTKKQSVAPVPKPIAKLALQFYPLFNPALFPHKPPPLSVASRFLFTDAEDELLAMGLMEYNTDWKAIQQRFLPCKTKHQIFVRQKNRCSSKAPDNPIKAVRMMKTSPLTQEEKARIHEGLRMFKLDWMSVWKYVVPYRDPSLLPRQWRIATGTQKSYKMDSARKEKRRLYEFKRRNRNGAVGSRPPSDMETENAGQNGSGEDCVGNANEAYVHEGFLADWRPPYALSVSFATYASHIQSSHQPASSAGRINVVREEPDNSNQERESGRDRTSEPSAAAAALEDPRTLDSNPARYSASETYNIQVPYSAVKKPFVFRPYKARRHKSSRLVKLAPDLPPVNLPPSVRVISQAAFRNANDIRCIESSGSGPSHRDKSSCHGVKENTMQVPCKGPALLKGRQGPEEKHANSDLEMHPLLFRIPEGGHLPYYPLNYSGRTLSPFAFFPVNPPQINLQKPLSASPVVAGFSKSACPRNAPPTSRGSDFHPLLQSSSTGDNNSTAVCPTAPLSVDLELSRNAFFQPHAHCNTGGQPAAKLVGDPRWTAPDGASALKLNINLNSAPGKEKDCSKQGVEHDLMASPELAVQSLDGATAAESNQAFTTDNGEVGHCEDTIGNHLLPEIVMEQEELSDSDDEIEDVEFECEEMMDSEGEEEGSDDERIVYVQNKDIEDVSPVTNCEVQLHECSNHEGNDSLGKDKAPSSSDSPKPREDGSSSPWLSLNSHARHATPPTITGKRAYGNLPR
ncbi:hypothetical protein Dimus_032951 [Dionaea muscipula]